MCPSTVTWKPVPVETRRSAGLAGDDTSVPGSSSEPGTGFGAAGRPTCPCAGDGSGFAAIAQASAEAAKGRSIEPRIGQWDGLRCETGHTRRSLVEPAAGSPGTARRAAAPGRLLRVLAELRLALFQERLDAFARLFGVVVELQRVHAHARDAGLVGGVHVERALGDRDRG